MPRARRSIALFAMGMFLVLGCGGNSEYGTLHSVTGKVILDGQPMTKGYVRLVPDGAKVKTEPAGEIAEDGTYTIYTGNDSGAPAGTYKVTVTSGEIPDSAKPNALKTALAPRYANPQTSGLTLEVVPSPAPGKYDLKVSAR